MKLRVGMAAALCGLALSSCQQPIVWSDAEVRILSDAKTGEQFVCGRSSSEKFFRCRVMGAVK